MSYGWSSYGADGEYIGGSDTRNCFYVDTVNLAGDGVVITNYDKTFPAFQHCDFALIKSGTTYQDRALVGTGKMNNEVTTSVTKDANGVTRVRIKYTGGYYESGTGTRRSYNVGQVHIVITRLDSRAPAAVSTQYGTFLKDLSGGGILPVSDAADPLYFIQKITQSDFLGQYEAGVLPKPSGSSSFEIGMVEAGSIAIETWGPNPPIIFGADNRGLTAPTILPAHPDRVPQWPVPQNPFYGAGPVMRSKTAPSHRNYRWVFNAHIDWGGAPIYPSHMEYYVFESARYVPGATSGYGLFVNFGGKMINIADARMLSVKNIAEDVGNLVGINDDDFYLPCPNLVKPGFSGAPGAIEYSDSSHPKKTLLYALNSKVYFHYCLDVIDPNWGNVGSFSCNPGGNPNGCGIYYLDSNWVPSTLLASKDAFLVIDASRYDRLV